MAKVANWYRFIFADGYFVECRGLSAQERKVEERTHGVLVAKMPAGRS